MRKSIKLLAIVYILAPILVVLIGVNTYSVYQNLIEYMAVLYFVVAGVLASRISRTPRIAIILVVSLCIVNLLVVIAVYFVGLGSRFGIMMYCFYGSIFHKIGLIFFRSSLQYMTLPPAFIQLVSDAIGVLFMGLCMGSGLLIERQSKNI